MRRVQSTITAVISILQSHFHSHVMRQMQEFVSVGCKCPVESIQYLKESVEEWWILVN